jgi:hypothetical protein
MNIESSGCCRFLNQSVYRGVNFAGGWLGGHKMADMKLRTYGLKLNIRRYFRIRSHEDNKAICSWSCVESQDRERFGELRNRVPRKIVHGDRVVELVTWWGRAQAQASLGHTSGMVGSDEMTRSALVSLIIQTSISRFPRFPIILIQSHPFPSHFVGAQIRGSQSMLHKLAAWGDGGSLASSPHVLVLVRLL